MEVHKIEGSEGASTGSSSYLQRCLKPTLFNWLQRRSHRSDLVSLISIDALLDALKGSKRICTQLLPTLLSLIGNGVCPPSTLGDSISELPDLDHFSIMDPFFGIVCQTVLEMPQVMQS